ncbi:MAG: type II toxin-antitoxin system VapC family toxin [Rectinemataceae bacterium]
MILLDTNYLIGLLVAGSTEAGKVETWFMDTELCTSSLAWYEFLSGPVDGEGVAVVLSMISDRVFPFTAGQAQEAARLWNSTGRLRRLRLDATIASAAILMNAELATANVADFQHFVPLGLRLRN